MKKQLRFNPPAIFKLWLAFHLIPACVLAQDSSQALPPGYYIVVAAYRIGQDTYAQNYISRIKNNNSKAAYGSDLGRGYLYVYLDYFSDFDISIKEMLATRKRDGFEKAWVRIMKDPLPEAVEVVSPIASPPVNLANDEPAVEKEAEVITEGATQTTPAEVPADSIKSEEVELNVTEEAPLSEPKPISESNVYLSLFHSTTNKPISGEVEIIDTERARLISKLKGNEYAQLPDPKSNSGRLTLLANVFGFRPLQHELNYQRIPGDTMLHYVEWSGNHYLVKFDLVRYHKGDINTLFNVYFFNDAAIMLPESRYQLNSLLEMLNENQHYRIMLHGHTNGNARGKIITMGESRSFFALTDDVKEGSGSAKDLSRERAEVIKQWLIDQGIAEDRIEVKAWGGGRMLHDQHSVNAKKNVRVDVEILAE